MTPIERYQADLQKTDFVFDIAQQAVVQHFQELYDCLLVSIDTQQGAGLLKRWKKKWLSEPTPMVKGLYLWGEVGRGKTYLMDMFYESLPFKQKIRVHFYRFMRRVHHELTLLAGEKNPLDIVADRLAKEARIICFDEFFVSDIGDAMILAGLFQALFDCGIILVATSNTPPDELYKDGLQRRRFLPTIDLLNEHTHVVHVGGDTDYRLRVLKQANLYYCPLDKSSDESLQKVFDRLHKSQTAVRSDQPIMVAGRAIEARCYGDDVAWFDFSALCDGPRSQNDYIELAQQFYAVLLSGVPALSGEHDDQARRFISLVDEFYDRNVKLIMSAAVPMEKLYRGTQLAFEFKRTNSRLLEMQSHEYLAKEHKH